MCCKETKLLVCLHDFRGRFHEGFETLLKAKLDFLTNAIAMHVLYALVRKSSFSKALSLRLHETPCRSLVSRTESGNLHPITFRGFTHLS